MLYKIGGLDMIYFSMYMYLHVIICRAELTDISANERDEFREQLLQLQWEKVKDNMSERSYTERTLPNVMNSVQWHIPFHTAYDDRLIENVYIFNNTFLFYGPIICE